MGTGAASITRPNSKATAIAYIKRKLGDPMLRVNVTDAQFDDLLGDAIVYFQEHHSDGTQEAFYKYQIKASSLIVTTSIENIYNVGNVITGQTSGAKIVITKINSDFLGFEYYTASGTITPGENIADTDMVIRTISGTPVVGDVDNKFIPVPSQVDSIVEIVSTNGLDAGFGNSDNTSSGLFSTQYHFRLQQLQTYGGGGIDLTSKFLADQYSATLQYLTVLKPIMDFNRLVNKIYLNHFEWETSIGNWLVFRVTQSLDPDTFTEFYADTWFLRYATELARLQWGQNLSKYRDVAILGGVSLNGPAMIEEAEARIEKLQAEMHERYRSPDDFFMA